MARFGPVGRRPASLSTLAVILGVSVVGGASATAQELVYFHARGCPYCERWEAEVLPVYGKTWEAVRFPLREVALSDDVPPDLSLDGSVQFKPTFVLVDSAGVEVGRVTGYNPEWFWAFLDEQIRAHDAAGLAVGRVPPSPSPCLDTPAAC